MFEGRIMGIKDVKETNTEELGLLMAGTTTVRRDA